MPQFALSLLSFTLSFFSLLGFLLGIRAIAQIIDEDEYEIEEVLEAWIEFLQQ